MENTFAEIKKRLNEGQKTLFSGTPCQIAGLKAFLEKDYENLVCVDFVCHGVPSPMAWREYIKHRANEDNQGTPPVRINMRSKETGWSRYQYATVFEYPEGKRYICKNQDNLFMKLFVGDYILRESCASCRFKGYHRASDITLGDFWGIWNIAPQLDDDKGISLVLTHSAKGEELLERILGRLVRKEVTLEEAGSDKHTMLYTSKQKGKREAALAAIKNGDIDKLWAYFPKEQKESVLSKLRRAGRKLVRGMS